MDTFKGDYITRSYRSVRYSQAHHCGVGLRAWCGCGLAMMCDIIAADTAKFGQPEIKRRDPAPAALSRRAQCRRRGNGHA